jgi:hypothetical protein
MVRVAERAPSRLGNDHLEAGAIGLLCNVQRIGPSGAVLFRDCGPVAAGRPIEDENSDLEFILIKKRIRCQTGIVGDLLRMRWLRFLPSHLYHRIERLGGHSRLPDVQVVGNARLHGIHHADDPLDGFFK